MGDRHLGVGDPRVFDFAAQHSAVHAFEHATLFYTGLALWWLIVDPLPRARLRPGGQRLALLGFSRLASAAVCLPLTWMTKPEYPLYLHAPRAFGISAIDDQHLAGAGMCFIEFLVFGIAFAAVFISMLGRGDASDAVAERARATAFCPESAIPEAREPSRSRTQGAWRALHARDRGRRYAPAIGPQGWV